MRKRSVVVWSMLLLGLTAVAGLRFSNGPLAKAGDASGEPWACPMAEDAEVRSDGPGRCPKCGMDLVPLSETEHKGHAGAAGDENHTAAEKAARAAAAGKVRAGKTTYYCPMHPSYTSDRPGDCPICNMSLVPLKAEDAATPSSVEGYANVVVREAAQERIGVRFGTVVRRAVSAQIRAVGKIEYDERLLSTVSLKLSGWVEELHVKATGEAVEKGDPLFDLYSPELLEAQRNFLLALSAREFVPERASADTKAFAEENYRSARERLLLWDITEEQLRALEERREPSRRMTIHSRVRGVVVKRNIVEGAYVPAGHGLYDVADLSRVWIHADVYEYEAPLIRLGETARVDLAGAAEGSLEGEVVYVYPYLNESTRTVRVRLEMENPDLRLKPGMYGSVFLPVALGEQLVVDTDAILDTGMRKIVFVVRDGRNFEPRSVTTGDRADGMTVVTGGLEEGERIVTCGNFLIDSESKLKSALLGGVTGGSHQH